MTVEMTEEEALDLLSQQCQGDDSPCVAEALNHPALDELTNELLEIALEMISHE